MVERTLSWITRHRRTVRDYERLPARHETYVYWAMITVDCTILARPVLGAVGFGGCLNRAFKRACAAS